MTGLRDGPYMNLMKFSKAKCKVLHMGWGNPKHKYRLVREWTESNTVEKDFGVLVDKKLNMTWQCAFTVRRPTVSWAASRELWPAGRVW